MTENLINDGGAMLQIAVPPELVDIGVAPDLQRFFDAMVYKLRRNAHKGRWAEVAMPDAMSDLSAEVSELETVIKIGSTAEILMEAADVANEALIVAAIALEAKDAALTPTDPEPPRQPAVDPSRNPGGEQSEGHGAA